MQEAVRPVSLSVTVIVAFPTATAVTRPLSDTVATDSSLDFQARTPPAGSALAFIWKVAPALNRVKSLRFRDREACAWGSSTGGWELSEEVLPEPSGWLPSG